VRLRVRKRGIDVLMDEVLETTGEQGIDMEGPRLAGSDGVGGE